MKDLIKRLNADSIAAGGLTRILSDGLSELEVGEESPKFTVGELNSIAYALDVIMSRLDETCELVGDASERLEQIQRKAEVVSIR